MAGLFVDDSELVLCSDLTTRNSQLEQIEQAFKIT